MSVCIILLRCGRKQLNLNDVADIELRNLHIHHIKGGGESGGAMAITVYNKDQKMSRRQLIIDNCTLHDCEPAWSEALTLNGNIEQFHVTNNRIYNMNNIGIDFIGKL